MYDCTNFALNIETSPEIALWALEYCDTLRGLKPLRSVTNT